MLRVMVLRREDFTEGQFKKCVTLRHRHVVQAVSWTQDWRGSVRLLAYLCACNLLFRIVEMRTCDLRDAASLACACSITTHL